ncbi:FHA domain-containing protein [Candidatus Poribacteria bacterium]|nr:FHA domain-containing protein [Candidatus Poribacteria bacterium]
MKRVLISLLFLLIWAGLAWGAPRVYVNEILNNPLRYHNTVVEIVGTVTNETLGTPTSPMKSYTLTDDFEGQIEVRSRGNLPALGKRFVVEGMFNQNQAGSIPYLIEVHRRESDTIIDWFLKHIWSFGLAVAIVVFLALLVTLLVVAFRPQRPAQVPQPDTKQPTPPATVTLPGAVPQPAERVPTTQHEVPRREPTVAYLEGIQASLTIIEGPADWNKVYPVMRRESIIGREGDIKLSDVHLTVSGEHVRLNYEGAGKFTLTHLSRTNTTRVNGQNVSESCNLQSGDEIQLGATKLRFEVKA